MNTRREFLAAGVALSLLPLCGKAQSQQRKKLILIELRGANDGLNTLVPFADPAYHAARPNIALKREQVIPLNDTLGLHQALGPLHSHWQKGELAVVQGLGYDKPNLSHFRSIEIWDAASDSDEYRDTGWLARAFSQQGLGQIGHLNQLANGAIIGNGDLGPMRNGVRVLSLQNMDSFIRQARLVDASGQAGDRSAIKHLLGLERNIQDASNKLKPIALKTDFPTHALGQASKTALQVLANGVPTLRLTHSGYDTHINQLGTQNTLLTQLAESMAALAKGLEELGLWADTTIATYAEFGRRVRENGSNGTDHGTANVHFALGGGVMGGLYGRTPSLTELASDGNLIHHLDYRAYYDSLLTGLSYSEAERVSILGKAYRGLKLYSV